MLDRLFYFLRRYIIPKPVFRFFQPIYHWQLALLGALIYGFPARGLTVIGVTGTNGKSTTVEMLHELFSAAGFKTASLSSIRFKIGGETVENKFKMTMPGRFFVQQFLRRAKNAGVTHVVLEVTSEGVKQFRHKYIDFAAAVLTNLTPEHIEAHGGFALYKKAKGELFKALGSKGISVVNLDDAEAAYFLSFPAKEKIGYALNSQLPVPNFQLTKVLNPSGARINHEGIYLYFSEGDDIFAPLRGRFNTENMLAAMALAESMGVSRDTVRKTFAGFSGVPGRMEEIQADPFRVIVDYAFTPNALRQVYQTLTTDYGLQTTDYGLQTTAKRTENAASDDARHQIGRLICVLGAAGGGRDKWKRPELGKIAGEYCAKIIITNEDPYDEDPRSIMEEVKRGVETRSAPCEIIEDRMTAIRQAIKAARPGDAVIITGKGSESSMAVPGGKLIPWDDRRAAREALREIKR